MGRQGSNKKSGKHALIESALQLAHSLFAWVGENPVPATLIGLGTALLGAWNNAKNRAATIFGHSMQAITHLDSRWDSPDLRSHKRAAANFLKRHLSAASPHCVVPSDEEKAALESVLNFLEAVGAFVKSGAIGERISWQLFGSAAQYFVEAAATQIDRYRSAHATIYSEVQFLYLVARVEEERRDWPAAWFWRRWTAAKLTAQSSSPGIRDWWYLPSLLYATVTGHIQGSRRLRPLFPTSELLDLLRRDARSPLSNLAAA
ncbi:MAG: DUF4760 domain-containing protein [Ramlibacter sp.]